MSILNKGLNVVVFDLEIKKTVEEIGGWDNAHLAGISTAVVWSYKYDRVIVYDEHRVGELARTLELADMVVGFNHVRFDYTVLSGTINHWISQKNNYDILLEMWKAQGLEPAFNKITHSGYGLDNVCKGTLNKVKTGHGANAPILFREGKVADVINYNINDVLLTKELFEHIDTHGKVFVPSRGMVYLPKPEQIYKGRGE